METLSREEHDRLVRQAYQDGIAEEKARYRSIHKVGSICGHPSLAYHLANSTELTIDQCAQVILAAIPSPAILPAVAERQAVEVLQ